jgi:sirohydrochlorin ferrochelatase
MIKPVADAIAAPGAQLRLAERHPELPQIPQLVDQLVARRLAARKRPGDLSMRQAEIERANTTYVVPHLICTGFHAARRFAAIYSRAELIPNICGESQLDFIK